MSFEEALVLGDAIQRLAAGHKVRRLTLFESLNRAPDSGASRAMITASSRYGITTGGYQADYLELTDDGVLATNSETPPRIKLGARFRLAILSIEPFNRLYEQYKNSKIPDASVMRDFLAEHGLSEDEVGEAVDVFLVNAKFIGLSRNIAGAERLLPIEHVLEETPAGSTAGSPAVIVNDATASINGSTTEDATAWSKICFYITPIGETGSEQRQHSDLFLSSIVEKALEPFGLRVVRADQIGKAGMIGRQVIEHIVRSRLVIADLSFHNPNVFYELALRHVCRLPTVQIVRASDHIPFDLDQLRTVKIDNSGIYTLLPQLQSYLSEIALQVRRALEDPEAVDNPITTFFPNLRVTVD